MYHIRVVWVDIRYMW